MFMKAHIYIYYQYLDTWNLHLSLTLRHYEAPNESSTVKKEVICIHYIISIRDIVESLCNYKRITRNEYTISESVSKFNWNSKIFLGYDTF